MPAAARRVLVAPHESPMIEARPHRAELLVRSGDARAGALTGSGSARIERRRSHRAKALSERPPTAAEGVPMNARIAAPCPACGGIVEVVDPRIGLEVDCPDCEEALIVTALDPLRLDYALDADEEPAVVEDERRDA